MASNVPVPLRVLGLEKLQKVSQIPKEKRESNLMVRARELILVF